MRKKIDIWKNSEVSSKTPHCPSDSQLNSMRSACDHLPTLAKDFFAKEVFGVPQTLNVNAESMYHGSKSDILKIFAPYSIDSLPASESDSAIIIEMSPTIRSTRKIYNGPRVVKFISAKSKKIFVKNNF